ncbi:MAG: hypothetical protein KAS12_05620 [Candidatus Aenigmarchaeota archaeon]|nr:hypothetical protein [Candidatus Aenigmarchaeota archaeon]
MNDVQPTCWENLKQNFYEIVVKSDVNWDEISEDRDVLNIAFLRCFRDKLNWSKVILVYRLTDNEIDEFADYIDWQVLEKSYSLNEKMIKKHRKKLSNVAVDCMKTFYNN